jgi:hypothetical protein
LAHFIELHGVVLTNGIKAAFNRQPQAFLGLFRFLGQQAKGGGYIFQPFELDPASFRKRFLTRIPSRSKFRECPARC